jgi:hypothetical protein
VWDRLSQEPNAIEIPRRVTHGFVRDRYLQLVAVAAAISGTVLLPSHNRHTEAATALRLCARWRSRS